MSYTLIGDALNLVALDEMTIALATANVTLSAGTVGGTAPSSIRHFRDQPSITREIESTEDDAWENENASPTADVTTASDVTIVVQNDTNADDRGHAGFRFRNIAINKNAKVNRAVLKVFLEDRLYSDFNADVYGHATASSTDFVTLPDINGSNNTPVRARTTATVAEVHGQWGLGWRSST